MKQITFVILYICIYFFKLGFTPCKTEQPPQGMKLQDKKHERIKAYRKSLLKETTVNRCLLILELRSFRS